MSVRAQLADHEHRSIVLATSVLLLLTDPVSSEGLLVHHLNLSTTLVARRRKIS